MRKLPLLAPALLLAACGQQQADDAAPAPTPEPVAPAATPAATPSPEASEIAQGQIPARYHGVWDAASGSCHPASDLRVEIEARQILFYESLGEVTGMSSRGDDAVAELAMEGEGERWTRSLRMTLTGSPPNERLVLADALETPRGDPIPLARCPR